VSRASLRAAKRVVCVALVLVGQAVAPAEAARAQFGLLLLLQMGSQLPLWACAACLQSQPVQPSTSPCICCVPACLQGAFSCFCSLLPAAAAGVLRPRGAPHVFSQPTSWRVYSLMCGCVHTCTRCRPLPPASFFLTGSQAGCRCPAGACLPGLSALQGHSTRAAIRLSCVAVPWGVYHWGGAGHMRGRRRHCAGLLGII
jgi:hypothetical protein